MGNRLDGNLALADEIRAIEQSEALCDIHHELIEWGLWGRNRSGLAPGLSPPGVWSLPGEYDPGIDEEAAPESLTPPINVKRVFELDTAISKPDFPALWRKVLKVNYIYRLPEWQRPRDACIAVNLYLSSLEMALEHLTNQ